jgi:hypothetical protein
MDKFKIFVDGMVRGNASNENKARLLYELALRQFPERNVTLHRLRKDGVTTEQLLPKLGIAPRSK